MGPQSFLHGLGKKPRTLHGRPALPCSAEAVRPAGGMSLLSVAKSLQH